MYPDQIKDKLGLGLEAGSKHYRAFVGPPEKYDLISAMQFNLLTFLGLREYHCLLDIGCGSLRAGRLFIPYLLPQHYYGIEPESWLVEEGIRNELGQELIQIKKPTFLYDFNFDLKAFKQNFDYIVAQSIFSHASDTQIRKCLQEVAGCLKPEGIFVATFIEGNEDYTGSTWVYPGCVEYTENFMKTVANEVNLNFEIIDWPHPNKQTWGLFHSKIIKHYDPTYLYCKESKNIKINEFIENIDGTGNFEGIKRIVDKIFVFGWARDPFTSKPASDVIILNQDNLIVSTAKVNQERRDVENSFRDHKMLMSGWEAKIKLDQLSVGEHIFRSYIYLPEQMMAIRICNELRINI